MKFPIHLFALLISASSVVAADWKKHIIHEGQHTLTAVGADFTGDGVIVGTPTGSTGHLLSSGAPIVVPDVRCMILDGINRQTNNHTIS